MTDTPPAADPWLGRTLASQFRILEPLGAGGMGSVYRAEQLGVDRQVVVKVMLPAVAERSTAVERFKREAKAIARLNHPNIVQIYVFGETDDGALFLAMECVEGHTLTALMRDQHRVGQARTLRIADQICAALIEAHAAGIVHRDLKPDNVMLSQRLGTPDWVTVLDFGVAKLVGEASTRDDSDPSLTGAGNITGTPRYMSPEQARSQPIDGRSDLYCLGLVLYEMLTGVPPYEGDSAVDYLVKHVTEEVGRPSERFTDLGLSPRVEHIITTCCAKDPDARYQSAADLQRAIREALRDLPEGHRPAPTPGQASLGPAPFRPPAPAPFPPPAAAGDPATAWVIGLLAALVVVAIGVGALWFLTTDRGAPARPGRGAPEERAQPDHDQPDHDQPDHDQPDRDPGDARSLLPAGEDLEGLPRPEGLRLMSSSPQAVVLTGALDPRDVVRFYRHVLAAPPRSWEVADAPNGLRIVSADADLTSVYVQRSAEGVTASLMRNALAPPPEQAVDGAFGEPLFAGAQVVVRTPDTVIYNAVAPVEDVIAFYVAVLGQAPDAKLYRQSAPDEPMLSLVLPGEPFGLKAVSVMGDATGPAGRVMITLVKQ